MRIAIGALVLGVATLGPVAASSKASAAPQATDVYDDIKSVVGELITQEFADSTTVWLACKSGALPRYYLRTLQRMQERQWGGLRSSLREDTANFAADFVYTTSANMLGAKWDGAVGLATPKSGEPASPAHEKVALKDWIAPLPNLYVAASKPGGVKDITLTEACAKALPSSGKPDLHWKRIILSSLKNADVNRLPTLNEQCGADKDARRRMACALARATKAAIEGKKHKAEVEMIDFVTRALVETHPPLAAFSDQLRSRLLRGVMAVIAGEKNVSLVENAVKPIEAIVHGTFAMDCATTPTTDYLALGRIAAGDGQQALKQVACAATESPRVLVSAGGAPTVSIVDGTTTIASMDLAELIAEYAKNPTAVRDDVIVSWVACRTLPCTNGVYSPTKAMKLKIPGGFWNVTTDKDKTVVSSATEGHSSGYTIQAIVRSLARVQGLQDKIQAARAALVGDGADDWAQARTILNLVVQVQDLLHDLEQLGLFSDDTKIDTAGLFEATLRIVEKSPQLCGALEGGSTPSPGSADTGAASKSAAKVTPDWCKGLSKLASYVDSHDDELRAILNSATRRDLRSLASQALRLALPDDGSADPESGCTGSTVPYKRLTLSFVSYVLDEEAAGDGREISRQAFRAAALDTLRCISDEGLEARPSAAGLLPWSFATSHSKDWRQFYFWSVAFRASWNAAYRNQAGSDGFRTTVSAPGLAGSVRLTSKASTVYGGLAFAAVDWIAPLAELALRRGDPHYHSKDGGTVLLELVRPRVDAILGVPLFSEHLALSAGVSWRIVAPFPGSPNDPAAAGDATYLPIWSGDDRVKNHLSWFWEFNAGVHYVF